MSAGNKMLVHQITEDNYSLEIEKGKKELQKKFDHYTALKASARNGIDVAREMAISFKDPTVWAYATLTFNSKPLEFFYYQDKFIFILVVPFVFLGDVTFRYNSFDFAI